MTHTNNPMISTLEIGTAQIELLEKLCNASAVTGDEGEVRTIVLEHVKSLADDVKVDALGNVLVSRLGKSADRLQVMVAAHMDEVGMMLVDNEDGGFFRFEIVGSLDGRVLPAKPVLVGRDHIPGVISVKPIHLTTTEERRRPISIDALHIDVGPESAGKVKIGDRVTFATRFSQVGPSLRAKALDNRLGVAILIDLVKNSPENIDLLAAFTVQEEIGARGARVAAFTFNPDLAIAVDTTPAKDLPTWDLTENTTYNSRLDAGPAIYLADGATFSDPRLIRHLVETAEEAHIPYQFRQPGGGGTDASAIQRQREGVPSISVSTPCRYTHAPAGIARLADWQNTLRLLHSALLKVTPSILAARQ